MVLLNVDATAGAPLSGQHQSGCKTRAKRPSVVVIAVVLTVVGVTLIAFMLNDDGFEGAQHESLSPFLNRSAARVQATSRHDKKSLNAFKATSMASIFAVAMLGGLAPYAVVRQQQQQQQQQQQREVGSREEQQHRRENTRLTWCDPHSILPVLNTASAGVFLTAGLMHLLADAISNEELSNMSRTFWGEDAGSLHAIALCVSGLVFLVGVEQVGHSPSRVEGCMGCKDVEHGSYQEVVEGLVGASNREDSVDMTLEGTNFAEGDVLVRNTSRPIDGSAAQTTTDAMTVGTAASSGAAALSIGIALSVHSVLEGLALGAQENIEQSLGIFVAILAHKGVAAFALGNRVVSYMQNSPSPVGADWALGFIACMSIFSMATPLGVAIAWGVTSVAAEEAEENPWSAAFSAVGAGTFLYVATVEVIPTELSVGATNRGIKFLALVIGAVVMGSLAFWI